MPNFMTLKCNIGSNVNLRIGFVKYSFSLQGLSSHYEFGYVPKVLSMGLFLGHS